MARSGAPDVRAASAWSNADMGSIGAVSTQLRLDLAVISKEQVGGFAIGQVVDTLAILATTHRAALVAALDREVDRLPNTGALSDADRASRVEELQAQLLQVERSEAHLCELGGTLPRADIDVRAFLGVA
jgi:hypothetical protein